MLYFDHDTGASRSEEMTVLRATMGGAAVDAYWMIIERLYESEEPLVFGDGKPSTGAFAYWLMTDQETLMKWIAFMVEIGLLIQLPSDDAVIVTSERVERKLDDYRNRRETNRKNGRKGGMAKALNSAEAKPAKDEANVEYSPSDDQAEDSQTPSDYQADEKQSPSEDLATVNQPLRQEKRREEKKREEKRRKDIEGGFSPPKPPSAHFKPPSVDDVRAYVSEKNFDVDPERFVDFYTAKGWMVGKNKMKDWKAAVRTWVKRNNETGKKVNNFAKYDR